MRRRRKRSGDSVRSHPSSIRRHLSAAEAPPHPRPPAGNKLQVTFGSQVCSWSESENRDSDPNAFVTRVKVTGNKEMAFSPVCVQQSVFLPVCLLPLFFSFCERRHSCLSLHLHLCKHVSGSFQDRTACQERTGPSKSPLS